MTEQLYKPFIFLEKFDFGKIAAELGNCFYLMLLLSLSTFACSKSDNKTIDDKYISNPDDISFLLRKKGLLNFNCDTIYGDNHNIIEQVVCCDSLLNRTIYLFFENNLINKCVTVNDGFFDGHRIFSENDTLFTQYFLRGTPYYKKKEFGGEVIQLEIFPWAHLGILGKEDFVFQVGDTLLLSSFFPYISKSWFEYVDITVFLTNIENPSQPIMVKKRLSPTENKMDVKIAIEKMGRYRIGASAALPLKDLGSSLYINPRDFFMEVNVTPNEEIEIKGLKNPRVKYFKSAVEASCFD